MRISRTRAGLSVVTGAYRLFFPAGRPFATLDDPTGRPWAQLALAWSAHRLDALDETAAMEDPEVTEGPAVTTIRVQQTSSAWQGKSLLVECREDELSLWLELSGEGALTDLHLLAGYSSADERYGSGWFPSERFFETLFSPEPHGPERIVRPAGTTAAIDIVGGPGPGRGHWFFTPPPFCFAFARDAPPADPYGLPSGPWLAAGLLTAPGEQGFTAFAYEGGEETFGFRLQFEGRTRVSGAWRSPALVLLPGRADPYEALHAHRRSLERRALVPVARTPTDRPAWWREPIFCGWGAQVHLADELGIRAPDLCTRERYDGFMATLEEHGVFPGTVVIDDKWQASYGRGEADRGRWPDLRGWVAQRHARGQHVLLWWKAWDPEGLPAEWCVRNAAGRAVAADPTSAAYQAHLEATLQLMLGRDGYDADGLKIDFTASAPSGPGLEAAGREWGVELLHALLALIHRSSKAAKADALIVAHAPNPYFADVADMMRLNDMLRLERVVPGTDVVRQMSHRAKVAAAACPGLLIDTDDWQVPDLAAWREYLLAQPLLGVPCLSTTRPMWA